MEAGNYNTKQSMSKVITVLERPGAGRFHSVEDREVPGAGHSGWMLRNRQNLARGCTWSKEWYQQRHRHDATPQEVFLILDIQTHKAAIGTVSIRHL